MQWRVMVEVSGAVGAKQVHEVHAGGSAAPGCSAATVGLSLAEAKAVLAGLQRHLVQAQAEEHCQIRRRCARCGGKRPLKDRRPRQLRSLFGTVEVRAPRFEPCQCSVALRTILSPVKEIMPDCCTPEYERVLAEFGALLPYRRARDLLETFFPVGDLPTIDTIQRRTLQVGARLECEAVATPTLLPPPTDAETIALSINSGHVRAVRSYQVRTFEVFVAQASNDDGERIVFSSVPVEADRQIQQLRGALHHLGATPCTDFTILSDGAEGPRSLGEAASIGPTCHVLDWFHLAMRIQHVAQAVKGWPDITNRDRQDGALFADAVEHVRWRLWHGQVQRALDLIGDTWRRSMPSPPGVGCTRDRGQGGCTLAWSGDVRGRAGGNDHRLRGGASRRGANIDGADGKRGAMAASSPDGRASADALVATGSAHDVEGSNRCRERHLRTRLCSR